MMELFKINLSAYSQMRLTRIRSPILPLLVCVLLGGCSHTSDGLVLYKSKKHGDRALQLKETIGERRRQHVEENGPSTIDKDEHAILIGYLGKFKNFSKTKTLDFAYSYYLRESKKIGLIDNVLSKSEFNALYSGVTIIVVADYVLDFSLSADVIVSRDKLDDLTFAESQGLFRSFAKGDLVVGKARLGFPYAVVEKVLCTADAQQEACAEDYSLGVFDPYSGRQLKTNFEYKNNGKTIHPRSFRKLSSDDPASIAGVR